MDPLAARAARVIGNSCLRASVAGNVIYPQATFPFEGKTDLIASGRWLSYGGVEHSTFLVYNLRSCSHPFPFRSLQYTSKSSQTPSSRFPPGGISHTGSKTIKHQSSERATSPLVEKDSSNNLARKVRQIKDAPRFPDLEKKYVWRAQALHDGDISPTVSGNASTAVDESAVGESGSDRRVRPVDLAMVTRSDSVNSYPVPSFLESTVEQLKLLENVAVELLTHSQHDGWTVPLSVLADEDGEIVANLLNVTGDEASQMRRAAVFAFKYENEHVCAVVIEASPPHTKIYATTGHSADEVWDTLKCATVDFVSGTHDPELAEDLSAAIRWIFGVDELDH